MRSLIALIVGISALELGSVDKIFGAVEVDIAGEMKHRVVREEGSGAGGDPVVDPVTEAPTDKVDIKGDYTTTYPWDEKLADKNSDEYKEKSAEVGADLKTIIEKDENIESVELTDITFTEAGARKKRSATKRQASKAAAAFEYVATVKKGAEPAVVQEAVQNQVLAADPSEFKSLDEDSIKSFKAVAENKEGITVPAVSNAVAYSLALSLLCTVFAF